MFGQDIQLSGGLNTWPSVCRTGLVNLLHLHTSYSDPWNPRLVGFLKISNPLIFSVSIRFGGRVTAHQRRDSKNSKSRFALLVLHPIKSCSQRQSSPMGLGDGAWRWWGVVQDLRFPPRSSRHFVLRVNSDQYFCVLPYGADTPRSWPLSPLHDVFVSIIRVTCCRGYGVSYFQYSAADVD